MIFCLLFDQAKSKRKIPLGGDYQLVDLYAMPDDEIKQKAHLGMLEYFMKYIHVRDTLKLWKEFLENFKSCILLDKEKDYIYIRSFLWYSDSKLPEDKYPDLENIIRGHLSKEDKEDKEDIMRTIAQKYREEGIQVGEEKGKLEGEMEKARSIAKSMLLKGYPIDGIIMLTGLSRSHIYDLV
ncbi:MAG: Rpn family recombination-promoting nuclease/putative transposase [Candidatus Cardinium sp.]|uniref:Rpn family recombination-promoting nuclease/putative transposase n=1 Tax=Cardinium endosymbiont of Dermatophagoides farinae TaxID=2597823 RepID=UPI001183A346|nr:Rpn family recombination-promoting nuclease/putative transposase [Cardinium endosymbiont of Dermatophagoides farinae]TSJ81053.1 hypothetical protein FPG78_03440 [Cardinium endosymbiont of Dermatophagoides farinae]UWW97082.1 MAG: Rpn family recombination-promoting nuclease/putative transposase [Candidatus Cardinium sp.]